MKIKVPKIQINRKKKEKTQPQEAAFDFTLKKEPVAAKDDSFGLIAEDKDEFAVSVRNSEPILRRMDTAKAGKVWIRDLQINLATAGLIMVMFSLILSSAYIPELIPFTIPVIVVFMILATLESFEKDKIRIYVAAAMAVALVVLLIVFRKYIGSGWALISGQFYDSAEEAQAYVYDRFRVGSMGSEHPNRSMHFALLWGSALLGLLAALPPIWARRTVGTAIAAFTMIAFAYYGIIPSGLCIAVLAVGVVFVMARGHILSSIPVLLIVMIMFGAIMLLDPGESYGISRADENFRDRFALRSSYLEKADDPLNELNTLDEETQEQKDKENDSTGSDFITKHRWVVALLVILAILAAAGAVFLIMYQKIRKKQIANRAGIDSKDPREAITAIFPYAVRWLQPAGIDAAGKSFDSLLPIIKSDLSVQYANNYTGMYELWKEAAYSDHEMTEARMQEMRSFLQETISMIKSKGNFSTNIINTLKYAL